MSEVKDLPIKCAQCGNKIQEGQIFYKHPIHGIVCEYCPAFKDGGVELNDDE